MEAFLQLNHRMFRDAVYRACHRVGLLLNLIHCCLYFSGIAICLTPSFSVKLAVKNDFQTDISSL